MSTNAKQAPTGASPVTNGSTTMNDTFEQARILQKTIQSFASNDGFRFLSHLTDQIPELKKNIQERDKRIEELLAQLENEKKSHIADDQKQLKTYTNAYETWKDEKLALNKNIQKLEATIQAKEAALETLTAQLGGVKTRCSDLAKDLDVTTEELKQRKEEVKSLAGELRNARADIASHSDNFKKSQSQVASLQNSLKVKTDDLGKLKEEATRTKDRLSQMLKFSAPMKALDIDKTANEIESLWQDAAALVRDFFKQNLPDMVLQNDWSILRENSTLSTFGLPFPQSNSEAAKDMRIVAVLGILARLVDKCLLQPTWLLRQDSGFREHLRHQAPLDPRKERFARGIILSMFPEEQEANCADRIDWVIEYVVKDSGIGALLPPETVETFVEVLEEFLIKVKTCWQAVQCGQQRLEPSFKYHHDAQVEWGEFELNVADRRDGDQPISPTTIEDEDDEVFVIFPRVFLMETTPKPITAGTVVRKSQLHAAAQEARKAQSPAPFEEPASSRHRRKSSRAMSMSSNAARGKSAEKRSSLKSSFAKYV